MKLHLKAFLIVVVIGVVGGWLFNHFVLSNFHEDTGSQKSVELMEKQGIPDFTGKTLDGKSFQLHSMTGKVVIINFWASWCSPCIEEVPSLIKLVKDQKGDVQLVAVSEDSSIQDIEIFLKSFPELRHQDIQIIWDGDHSLMKQFDAARLPESLVADKQMKLAKKIIGSINWFTPDSTAYMKSLSQRRL